MTNDKRNPKSEKEKKLRLSELLIRDSFVIRHLGLVIPLAAEPAP